MAGGAALLLAGGVVNYVAYSNNQDLLDKYPEKELDYSKWIENREGYEQEYADSVKPLAITSYVLYGVGGAAAAAGIVWILVDGTGSGGPAGDSGPKVGLLDPAVGTGLSLEIGF